MPAWAWGTLELCSLSLAKRGASVKRGIARLGFKALSLCVCLCIDLGILPEFASGKCRFTVAGSDSVAPRTELLKDFATGIIPRNLLWASRGLCGHSSGRSAPPCEAPLHRLSLTYGNQHVTIAWPCYQDRHKESILQPKPIQQQASLANVQSANPSRCMIIISYLILTP